MTKLLLVLFLQISQERPVIQRELCIVRQPQCVRACVSKYVFSVLQKSIGTCVCVCVGVRACLQMQTHIQVQTSILLQEYLEVGNGSSCKWVQKFDFFLFCLPPGVLPVSSSQTLGLATAEISGQTTLMVLNLIPATVGGLVRPLDSSIQKKNLFSNLYSQPIIQQVLSPHSLKIFRGQNCFIQILPQLIENLDKMYQHKQRLL